MRKREAYQLGAASSHRHLRNSLRPCPVQRARGRGPAGALDFVSLFHLYHGPPDRLPQGPIAELAVDGFGGDGHGAFDGPDLELSHPVHAAGVLLLEGADHDLHFHLCFWIYAYGYFWCRL
mgnify:CR=1 FL=1